MPAVDRSSSLPNVLLIVMDTTRADTLSCYGHARRTSPFLDRFAVRSTLFTRAYSGSSWTVPSHGTLFTGLPSSLHGMYVGRHAPVQSAPFLTDVLADRGYECHTLSSNPMLFFLMQRVKGGVYPIFDERPYLPSGRFALRMMKGKESAVQGFNPLRPGGRLRHLRQKVSHLRRRLAPGVLNVTGLRRGLYVPDDATPATRNSVRRAQQILRTSPRPYFMFMNLMQAHCAYNPPRETLGAFGSKRSWSTLPDPEVCHSLPHGYRPRCKEEDLEQLRAVYDEELLFQDRMLGKLFDSLEASGELDRTLVILTSDHGEALGEHRQLGHGCSLYNEAVRVPFIVHFPKSAAVAPGTDSRLESLQDVYATVLACAGIDSPNPHSISLLERPQRESAMFQQPYEDSCILLHRCERCARENTDGFWDRQGMVGLVDRDDRKILRTFSERVEIYDLARDPGESVDLSHRAEWKEDLVRKLDQAVAATGFQPRFKELKDEVPGGDAEELEDRLRALGYI